MPTGEAAVQGSAVYRPAADDIDVALLVDQKDVVPAVTSLMKALIARGMRVLAQCEYAEELPGGGEVTGAAVTP